MKYKQYTASSWIPSEFDSLKWAACIRMVLKTTTRNTVNMLANILELWNTMGPMNMLEYSQGSPKHNYRFIIYDPMIVYVANYVFLILADAHAFKISNSISNDDIDNDNDNDNDNSSINYQVYFLPMLIE